MAMNFHSHFLLYSFLPTKIGNIKLQKATQYPVSYVAFKIILKEVFYMAMEYCPVAEKYIDGGDCIIICDVAEEVLEPDKLPAGIEWNEKKCEKCKNCKYHD